MSEEVLIGKFVSNTSSTEYRLILRLISISLKVKQPRYRSGVAQRVPGKLRFPDFMTTALDGDRLSALRTGRLYPQEMLLVLISVRGWVDLRAIVRSGGLCQGKIPMTSSGIEPETFRFVAQHLNRCATAVPTNVIIHRKTITKVRPDSIPRKARRPGPAL